MKLTVNRLRSIISEEVKSVMAENRLFNIEYDVVDKFGVVRSGSASKPAASKRDAERTFRADYKADLKKGERLKINDVFEI